MSTKSLVWLGMFVGSTAGAYVPLLWHAGLFSFSSAIAAAVGGLTGIWLGLKLGSS